MTNRCEFRRTRAAISMIEDERLRADFDDLLDGVQFGLDEYDIELVNDVINCLAFMSRALCRTIGGLAATKIIDGLNADGKASGIRALRFPDWTSGRRCDLSGTRSCISATNSKCHSDSAGCISTDDKFSAVAAAYRWAVLLDE